MNLDSKSLKELIVIARNTIKNDEMKFFASHPYMNIRRSLAKNINIEEKILSKLEMDPVENVSYIAFQNPKSSSNSEFINLRPCVVCYKDEELLDDCITCDKIQDHRF